MVTAFCITLSGCTGSASIDINITFHFNLDSPPTVDGIDQVQDEGTATVNIGGVLSGTTGTMSLNGVNTVGIDANGVLIDTTGSTFSLPASGSVTLTLTDSGATLGAHSFPWVKQGVNIKFTSPSDVNQWLQTTGQNAANPILSYQLAPFAVESGTGSNAIVANFVYQGTQQAAATRQWTNNYICVQRPTPHCYLP